MYAVRGEADNENSSGWRFFQTESGASESEIVTCELWEVMMVDSSVMELLDRPSVIGSAFHLNDDCEFAEE